MPTQTDRVRALVRAQFIEPAKKRGDATIRISARDVHRAAGLQNRIPIVVNALRSEELLAENQISIQEQTGPPSGYGPSVEITYRLRAAKPEEQDVLAAFDRLRGIAKDVFESLGGGEAFIRRERAEFYGGPDPILSSKEHE